MICDPNCATVGLSEEKARERHGAVDIYKASFRALKLTLTDKHERTFIKLVVDQASQRVVGAHMIGPDAGKVIQGIASNCDSPFPRGAIVGLDPATGVPLTSNYFVPEDRVGGGRVDQRGSLRGRDADGMQQQSQRGEHLV